MQAIEDHGGDPDLIDTLSGLLTATSSGGQLGATTIARGKDSRESAPR